MLRAYCETGKHYPDVLIASVYKMQEQYYGVSPSLFVQLSNNGVCNNYWEDGTFGVQQEIQELAEEDEEPICAEHKCFIKWEHET